MRTEQQVIEQILGFAQSRDDIRAAAMNGSRVNPNAPKDIFQDYDIALYVENPRKYLEDQSWISSFGELIILQQNDFDDYGTEGYIFLMLFTDGVRIDLGFNPLVGLEKIAEDTLTLVLLDKDGRIPPLPPPSDSGYINQKPTAKEFNETVNEIFWCSNNTAKGIWRDELPYVKTMNDSIIRDECVVKLLGWYAAMLHGWTIGTGKFGKWLKRYLPDEMWSSVEKMYACADYEQTWDAIFEMCALVRAAGIPLAEHLGYVYPLEDDRRTVAYLRHVRALPKDASAY